MHAGGCADAAELVRKQFSLEFNRIASSSEDLKGIGIGSVLLSHQSTMAWSVCDSVGMEAGFKIYHVRGSLFPFRD